MGTHKALFIGVNKYLDQTIRSLDNVVNDVLEMSTVITSSPSPFAAKDIKVIYNSIATRTIITAAAQDFFLNASNDDVLVFYWAGHGALVIDEGFFATYDTSTTNIRETTFAMEDLRQYIECSPAKTIIAVFDCCHSGAITRSITDYTQVFRGLTIQGIGKVLFAACTYFQEAYEDDIQPHGRFTASFLEGIKGGAADGNGEIDVNNLFSYVAKKMEAYEHQTPVYNGTIQGRIVLKSVSRSSIGQQIQESKIPLIINDSGYWCLLNELPIKFAKIEENNGEVIITIENPSSHMANFLREIQKDMSGGFKVNTVTFHNYSIKVNTVNVSCALHGCKEVFIIRLKRDERSSSILEMAVGLGGMVSVSPDEIAELRARRILLSERRGSEYSRAEWGRLEWCIAGQGDIKINDPPQFTGLDAYQDLEADYWRLRRLYYIYLLIHSSTVATIVQLELSVNQNELTGINFEGNRPRQYVNQVPATIKIVGAPTEE